MTVALPSLRRTVHLVSSRRSNAISSAIRENKIASKMEHVTRSGEKRVMAGNLIAAMPDVVHAGDAAAHDEAAGHGLSRAHFLAGLSYRARLRTQSIATRSDARTVGQWYSMDTGKRKASIPLKCIAQMPIPIAMAPPVNQATRTRPACSGYASRKIERGIGSGDGDHDRTCHLAVVVGAGHYRVSGDHHERPPSSACAKLSKPKKYSSTRVKACDSDPLFIGCETLTGIVYASEASSVGLRRGGFTSSCF